MCMTSSLVRNSGYFVTNRLIMVVCFIAKSSHVTTIILKDRRTVSAKWCTTICLPEVSDE